MSAVTKKGYANGSDLLLYLNGKAIGHCTSHSITFNSETKERAVKPVSTATLTSGLWKNKGVTALSFSGSGEGLRFYEETESGYKALFAAWKTGKSIAVKAMERGASSAYLEGNVIITSLEESAPAQDDATYTVNFENDGEPSTLDETAITENEPS